MKITILGAAGHMGSMHARHLIEMGHEISCLDLAPLPDDLRPYTKAFGWDESDAAVIATPAALHERDVAAAIFSGLHVFVEKPICLIGQTKQMRTLLHEAQHKNLVVATGYNLRFHPLVMQAKDAIATGQLKPLWGSFLLRQKPARPIAHFLEEWASHEVDLALHLLGPAGREHLIERRRFTHNPDYLQALIQHSDISVRWDLSIPPRSFIHADAGTPEPFRRSFTLVDQNGRSLTSDIETDHVQPAHYKAELQAWLDLIQVHGEDLKRSHAWRVATGWDGLAAIELLEKLVK